MDLSTRLKGLLDPGILGGMFDGSPDETLSRFLPTDQIDRIPADQRAWYAQQAIRSTQADGRAGAQQRLLEFAKLREDQILAAEKKQNDEINRREALQIVQAEPFQQALDTRAIAGGPQGPTMAAQMQGRANQADLKRRAVVLEAKGGPKILNLLDQLYGETEVKPGYYRNNLTNEVGHRVEPEKNQTVVNGVVSNAPGSMQATQERALVGANVDIYKGRALENPVLVPGPTGPTYQYPTAMAGGYPQPPAPQGYPQPQAPGRAAPQVPGLVNGNAPTPPRRAPAPQQQGTDFDRRISTAAMAGDPGLVASLEADRARAMGLPAPVGQSPAFTNAVEIQRDMAKNNAQSALSATTKTIQPSYDSALIAASGIPKARDLLKIIDSGVYAKKGIFPGDWVEAGGRLFNGDNEKLANTEAVRKAGLEWLLSEASKLKPIANADIELLKNGIANPNSMTEKTMRRIVKDMIESQKKVIETHNELLGTFQESRIEAAFGRPMSVKAPADPGSQAGQIAPGSPTSGLGTPSVSGRVGGQPARPGFTFREVK